MNGKAKTEKASPPCFISSRLDIFLFQSFVLRFVWYHLALASFILIFIITESGSIPAKMELNRF